MASFAPKIQRCEIPKCASDERPIRMNSDDPLKKAGARPTWEHTYFKSTNAAIDLGLIRFSAPVFQNLPAITPDEPVLLPD